MFSFCSKTFPLSLGAKDRLRDFIAALPGPSNYLFWSYCNSDLIRGPGLESRSSVVFFSALTFVCSVWVSLGAFSTKLTVYSVPHCGKQIRERI